MHLLFILFPNRSLKENEKLSESQNHKMKRKREILSREEGELAERPVICKRKESK